jgi:hypothetical protein
MPLLPLVSVPSLVETNEKMKLYSPLVGSDEIFQKSKKADQQIAKDIFNMLRPHY